EWYAMGMVPVQVTQQDGASKRPAVQQGGQTLQAGSGVEHEAGGLPVVGQRNAGGIASIPHELRPRRRRRTSHTADEQSHRRGVYGLRAFRSRRSAPPIASVLPPLTNS